MVSNIRNSNCLGKYTNGKSADENKNSEFLSKYIN